MRLVKFTLKEFNRDESAYVWINPEYVALVDFDVLNNTTRIYEAGDSEECWRVIGTPEEAVARLTERCKHCGSTVRFQEATGECLKCRPCQSCGKPMDWRSASDSCLECSAGANV